MKKEFEKAWVDIPMDRIAVLLDPERNPVQLKFTFADGSQEFVPAGSGTEQAPRLEKILCSKIAPAQGDPPHWWG